MKRSVLLCKALMLLCLALISPVAKGAGTCLCWGGYSPYGELSPPAGLSNAVAVASGFYHNLALRNDGTVFAWGDNTYGQRTIPNGLNNVIAISCGGFHNLVVRTNGTVIAWGNDQWGQTNVPPGLSNIIAVAGGYYHSMALRANGTVVVWGSNYYNETNIPYGLTNVVAIACGWHYCLALKSDGSLIAWGQVENSSQTYVPVTLPSGLKKIVAIAANRSHGLGLQYDGTVAAWGYYSISNGIQMALMTVPATLHNVAAIATGDGHCVAVLTNGSLFAWGANYSGQTNCPVINDGFGVSCGTYHSVALRGSVSEMGSLQVNLQPLEAVSAGAQWQVDGGNWQTNGTTLTNLTVGSHTVSFNPVYGMTTPTNQSASIAFLQNTSITGTYAPLGSLQVIISPNDAVNAGAQWQIDGGAWQNSGITLTNLSIGNHTIAFNQISNWTTPLNQNVTINFNQTTTNVASYNPLGAIQIDLGPPAAVNAGAEWQVDGGTWLASGSTVANLALGNHTISFLPVADWATPSNQTVIVSSNQTTTTSVNYGQLFGSLQVNIIPAGAVGAGAQWQVDGGVWQNNGTVVAGLTLGSHTVSFSGEPGWGTPGSQVVTVNANQTTIASASYFAPHPATAMAIVTNGFVVSVALSDTGIGYTNTPLVYLLGGGGTGAHAVAVVSNGYVTGFTIINPGHGYTNVPIVAINPPYPLSLGIESATAIGFTNLQFGTNYQLQMSQSGVWANLGSPFVADAGNYTQYFDGTVSGSLYQLMALPIPYGATATPILSYGFVVAATVNDGGSGYVTIPGVQITGGGGSGAQATATVSNGVVTAVNVSNPGIGYSSSPTIQIDPPPIPSLQAITTKAVRLDFSGLTPGLAYRLQSTPDLIGWTNLGTAFTAADYTNSQYLNFESNSRFLRLWQP